MMAANSLWSRCRNASAPECASTSSCPRFEDRFEREQIVRMVVNQQQFYARPSATRSLFATAGPFID